MQYKENFYSDNVLLSIFYKEKNHPGGTLALETRAGGAVDCNPDYKFHSKNTRKLWNNYLIGYVAK